jgi:hypothetical protein
MGSYNILLGGEQCGDCNCHQYLGALYHLQTHLALLVEGLYTRQVESEGGAVSNDRAPSM